MPVLANIGKRLSSLGQKELHELVPAPVNRALAPLGAAYNHWLPYSARKGLKYVGLPVAAYAGVSALNAPEYGYDAENDDARWSRISTGHLAAGGILGGLLGFASSGLLGKGLPRIAAPFIGAAVGAGVGHEYTAPEHYLQNWKTRRARRSHYPTGASQAAGLPFVVAPEEISMGADEMRRRQLLGF